MKNLKELKRDYEKFLIETTLKNTNGDIEEASKVLKIKTSTLHRKINKYNINHKEGGKY